MEFQNPEFSEKSLAFFIFYPVAARAWLSSAAKKTCSPRHGGGVIHGMSFPFKVRAGRGLRLICGVAAMLCVAEAPAAAQEYFSSPGDKPGPRPLPWQERGLHAALADASPLLRSHAVQHLTYRGWARTLLTARDLEPLLQSPDEEIKKRAAEALAQMSATPAPGSAGPAEKEHDPFQPEDTEDGKRAPEKIAPERMSQLLTQLHDPSERVRQDAVRSLGRARTLATPEMSGALLPLLHDPDLSVISSTVQALRGMGREDAACHQALLHLLKAQDPPAQHDDPLKPSAFNAQYEVLPLLTPADLESSPEFIALIVRMLKDPAPFVNSEYTRSAVSDCVQGMGPKIAPYLKDLLPLLQDTNPFVQAHVMYALTNVGDEAAPTVARALLPLFKSTDDTVRYLTVNYIYRLGPAAAPVVVPALLPFLQKTNDVCRLRAIISLGRLGAAAAPAARELLAVLDHPDTHGVGHLGDFSQHAAAEALGQLGPSVVPLVVPALVQHFKDGDVMLGFSILRAFESMEPTAAPLAIPAALPMLQSTDGQTKVWASETLALWGNFQRDPAWQCAALAGASAAAKDDDLQYFRFRLYLWSGHDADLLLSVRWLGKPAAAPMPAHGKGLDAAEQSAALSVFLTLWDASAPYPALRREIAQRTVAVAQSITAAPEEKLTALLTSLDASLKADTVKETQPASTAARRAVQKALAQGRGKR